jgi:predicted glycosyltransferase
MDNSPHVFLLTPFVKSLEKKGHSVRITARDYAQTIDLLKNSDLSFTKIGTHGGANKWNKVLNLLKRIGKLLIFARRENFHMAINHGSRAQSVACKILRIPCFIGMDYEHTESNLFSICATRIWIPELLFPASLASIGIRKERVLTYAGIKEQFYLQNFEPDPLFKKKHDIPEEKILVVLRPPAEMANYHDHKSEILIKLIIERLRSNDLLFTICTPRTPQQKSRLKKFESKSFKVNDATLDGKNLAYFADIMISGGGTMNREAAYFGAHVYSIFSGRRPMLDTELQKLGLLTFVELPEQCAAIHFRKKNVAAQHFLANSGTAVNQLIDQFASIAFPIHV